VTVIGEVRAADAGPALVLRGLDGVARAVGAGAFDHFGR
jgi:hypothetical protein